MEALDLSIGLGHRVEIVVRRGDIEKAFFTKVEAKVGSTVNVTQFLPEALVGRHHNFEEVLLQTVVDNKLLSCRIDIKRSEKDYLEFVIVNPIRAVNRRKNFRVSLIETIKVVTSSGSEMLCTLRDVSTSGAAFVSFCSLCKDELHEVILCRELGNSRRKFEIVRLDVSADGRYFYGVRFVDDVDICKELLEAQRRQIKIERDRRW